MANEKSGASVKQQIVDLHEEGKTAPEIADVVQLSEARVQKLLANLGRTRFDRGGDAAKSQRDADRALVSQWLEDDVPERTMARQLKRSRSYVKTLKRELGEESGPKLSERDQEIVRLFLDGGMSQIEIGEKFGISNSRVSQIIRRAGYSEEDQRKADEDWVPDDELQRLYDEEGLSLRGVAKAVGMSKSGVRDRLSAMGVELRPPSVNVAHPKRVEEMEARNLDIAVKHLRGATLEELAEEYELSHERIRQIVRDTAESEEISRIREQGTTQR